MNEFISFTIFNIFKAVNYCFKRRYMILYLVHTCHTHCLSKILSYKAQVTPFHYYTASKLLKQSRKEYAIHLVLSICLLSWRVEIRSPLMFHFVASSLTLLNSVQRVLQLKIHLVLHTTKSVVVEKKATIIIPFYDLWTYKVALAFFSHKSMNNHLVCIFGIFPLHIHTSTKCNM